MMYHQQPSEDELLARRLQEEEERNLGLTQRSNHSALSAAMSDYSHLSTMSAQEREDMMLARQMQEMDSFGMGGGSGSGRHNNYDTNPPIPPSRRVSGESSGAYAAFAASSAHNSRTASRSPPPPPATGSGSGNKEDRLAYARRLQEQAFQRMQAEAQPQKSTEESDLELAMKMQIEEGGGGAVPDEADDDLKLALFMEESGVSIRDLDDQGMAAARGGSASALPPASSSLGLGSSSNTPTGGIPTGGILGGLYDYRRRGDSDDENSIEFGFENDNRKMPAGVPSSIPSPARSNGIPSGIPPSIPAAASIPPAASMPTPQPTAASIPSGIPPASAPTPMPPPGNRKPPPPGSAPPASIDLAAARQASLRLSANQQNTRGNDFQRHAPKPSKSSGGRIGRAGPLSRMLPSASKSFGSPRSRNAPRSRNVPSQTQSAHNLLGMRNAARTTEPKNNNNRSGGRSLSPTRRGARRNERDASQPPLGMDLIGDPNLLGDPMNNISGSDQNSTPAKKKKGVLKRMFRGGKKNRGEGEQSGGVPLAGIPAGIPAAIPGPPGAGGGGGGGGAGGAGPIPHSVTASRNINQNSLRTSFNSGNPTITPEQAQKPQKQVTPCSVCGGRNGKMLVAMDKKFHVDCFRCMSCNELIDPTSVFAVSVDPMGGQQPLHRKCYAEFYGVQCAVCKRAIPANEDGSVSFIKHPFFSTEQMCPNHAEETGRRRCTGCHRFEPEDEPFADLNDGDRCVCHACCRTVIMNNMDVKPLWQEVLRFFEFNLELPIWEEMREIPILVVGQAALNENQLKDGTSVHGDSSQIMTRGLCLSEHDGSMSFRVPSQRFNDSTCSFEACNHSGFLDLDVGVMKGNANSEVMAILCLSGLPRDLTASVLAHEATHAWIKLHPDFKVRKSLPPQVEEGCAQLVAYLFLSDGLEAPRRHSGLGPSDEKLRQYFKFSIETDDNDIYGEGYRRAALAYSTIGIAALLNHVVHYQSFPSC